MIRNGLYHLCHRVSHPGRVCLTRGNACVEVPCQPFPDAVGESLGGAKLSEYHSGYRAFSRKLLAHLNLEQNSDDFALDNEMLIQIIWHGYAIAEVICPTAYNKEASSINFRRSVKYGFGCLRTALIAFG